MHSQKALKLKSLFLSSFNIYFPKRFQSQVMGRLKIGFSKTTYAFKEITPPPFSKPRIMVERMERYSEATKCKKSEISRWISFEK